MLRTPIASLALALAAAVMLSLPRDAEASVPPPDWSPPTWRGPGLLCASGFMLQLDAGEQVVQGFPSVGLIPFSIESEGASFRVVENWFGPRDYRDRRLIRTISGGRLYSARGYGGPIYLMMPHDRDEGRTILVEISLPPSIGAEAERVLRRVTLPTADTSQCLRPVGGDGRDE